MSGQRRPALILHEREVPVAMAIGEAGAPAQALTRAHLLLFPGPPSLPSILIASARARWEGGGAACPAQKLGEPHAGTSGSAGGVHPICTSPIGTGAPGVETQSQSEWH